MHDARSNSGYVVGATCIRILHNAELPCILLTPSLTLYLRNPHPISNPKPNPGPISNPKPNPGPISNPKPNPCPGPDP